MYSVSAVYGPPRPRVFGCAFKEASIISYKFVLQQEPDDFSEPGANTDLLKELLA